jgi:nuclear-control-of-ATPase protein 2
MCECHVLQQAASNALPGTIYREFKIDLDDLTDIKVGLKRQKAVLKRIQWGYSKWF